MLNDTQEKVVDPILNLLKQYHQDTRKDKINLGIGVYTNEQGKTPILHSVKQAQSIVLEHQISKNYLNITGVDEFNAAIENFLLKKINKQYSQTLTTVGGTGALFLSGKAIHSINPESTIWISEPTWNNHLEIFKQLGMKIRRYPYYDKKSHTINFDHLVSAISQANDKDTLLLQAQCHNPTGCDLTEEQWKFISKIALKKQLFVILDSAYLGLGKSIEQDMIGIKTLAEELPLIFICHSCSKNFGLYRERTGSLTLTSNKPIQSIYQLVQKISRSVYSMPPAHGAHIVATLLNSPELYQQWQNELSHMKKRIHLNRQMFVQEAISQNCPLLLNYLTNQQGMFSLLDLTSNQVFELKKRFGIYLLDSGRINVAGIQQHKIPFLINALNQVIL